MIDVLSKLGVNAYRNSALTAFELEELLPEAYVSTLRKQFADITPAFIGESTLDTRAARWKMEEECNHHVVHNGLMATYEINLKVGFPTCLTVEVGYVDRHSNPPEIIDDSGYALCRAFIGLMPEGLTVTPRIFNIVAHDYSEYEDYYAKRPEEKFSHTSMVLKFAKAVADCAPGMNERMFRALHVAAHEHMTDGTGNFAAAFMAEMRAARAAKPQARQYVLGGS